MGGSLRLGAFAGIGVFIHWTFFLLIAWVIGAALFAGDSVANALSTVLLVLAVFACVVLHEYGHALTARRFGIGTRDITLLPIGGVARLNRIPERPGQELLVAIAGPLVNVAIVILLLPIAFLTADRPFANVAGPEVELGFLESLIAINIALVIFNMIPAFPMDGGRALRAILAMFLDRLDATRIAAILGQTLAVVLGLIGLFVNPFLLLIAVFVFLGAQAEARGVERNWITRGIPAREAMLRRFETLRPDDPISTAADRLIAGWQTDFPVLRDGRVVGLIGREDIFKAVADGRRDAPVESFLHPTQTIRPDDSLEEVFDLMQREHLRSVPVIDGDHCLGMMSLENISEWLMLHQSARLGRKPKRQSVQPFGLMKGEPA